MTPEKNRLHCMYLHKAAAMWFSFFSVPLETEENRNKSFS